MSPFAAPVGNAARVTRSVCAILNQNKKMKSGLRDKVEGKAKQAKGAVKQKIGRKTGDPGMKARGKVDEATGKFQQKTGQIKRDITRE